MKQQYLVKTVAGPVDWDVTVPGSKSMTNRALLMAALSAGPVEVEGVLFSDDSRHFLSALAALGFELKIEEAEKKVAIIGTGGQVPKKEAKINVGSAGTTARFLTAMLGFSDGIYTVQASEQMKRRPMKPLFDLLESVGAEITYLEQEGHLPARIRGREAGGVSAGPQAQPPLAVSLDITDSTQFLSALLLIAPMIRQGLSIHITSDKTDGSYVRITRKMMEDFRVAVSFDGKNYGVSPGATYRKKSYKVEPDMSAACYFYAAAAVTGGRAVVQNVHFDNTQGDIRFLEVLQKMGCAVADQPRGITVEGPVAGALKGIRIDMNDFSDQALTLAAIAPFAESDVTIFNIGHIRGQECDRIHAITTELRRLGIACEEQVDAVTIHPGMPQPGVVETYEDHRVAMAFALIGLRARGIVIDHPECCKKTFEEYFDLLEMLTIK